MENGVRPGGGGSCPVHQTSLTWLAGHWRCLACLEQRHQQFQQQAQSEARLQQQRQAQEPQVELALPDLPGGIEVVPNAVRGMGRPHVRMADWKNYLRNMQHFTLVRGGGYLLTGGPAWRVCLAMAHDCQGAGQRVGYIGWPQIAAWAGQLAVAKGDALELVPQGPVFRSEAELQRLLEVPELLWIGHLHAFDSWRKQELRLLCNLLGARRQKGRSTLACSDYTLARTMETLGEGVAWSLFEAPLRLDLSDNT